MDVREKLVELPIEDALLILREEHRQRTDSYTTYLAHGGEGDPAEEVGLDALAMAISALEKTKWISVKDELPPYNRDVLVYRPNMAMKILVDNYAWHYRDDDDEWYEDWALYGKDTNGNPVVTHWAYLPQPPSRRGGQA